jgi:hypothetical protein
VLEGRQEGRQAVIGASFLCCR